jgi:hypothetical protein
MDGGDPWHSCPRARGAHPAGEVGATAMGGAACVAPPPLPRDAVTGEEDREKQRWGKELTGGPPM